MLRPSRWSLRARLLAALVSLLALVCLAVGVATAVALRHFLLGRLDAQLVAAGAGPRAPVAGHPEAPAPPPTPGTGRMSGRVSCSRRASRRGRSARGSPTAG
ncbi:MAG TPA: hypothetical protein VKP11_04755 [Frankiaceae bacterium]|nr:hypothetical protein [Frankiaceae bacterium]